MQVVPNDSEHMLNINITKDDFRTRKSVLYKLAIRADSSSLQTNAATYSIGKSKALQEKQASSYSPPRRTE